MLVNVWNWQTENNETVVEQKWFIPGQELSIRLNVYIANTYKYSIHMVCE